MKSKTSKKGLHVLLRELSDDEDDASDGGPNVPDDPDRPWLRYFHEYIDKPEHVPEGWSSTKWWGVSLSILVVWDARE
jgi:hypothetical protein